MKTVGCVVCGSPLHYFGSIVSRQCDLCGIEKETQVICSEGHFVCDVCHQADALKIIEKLCSQSESKNPFELATMIMSSKKIPMHGPEHHSLVPAVIVAAYNNKAGLSKHDDVQTAIKRGSKVCGGFCGFFGACGAGIGVGIAISIIEKTSPIKAEKWAEPCRANIKALRAIADQGGPRCCKRCVLIALNEAVKYIQKEKGVRVERTILEGQCTHTQRNKECQQEKCPFYPQRYY
jgi:hypothetical protein